MIASTAESTIERRRASLSLEFFDVAVLLGDVAGDGQGADDGARCVPDGRHGQRHVDAPAVFRHPDGVVVLDTLATADPLEQMCRAPAAIRAHENPDWLADDFLRRIPVDPFGARGSSSGSCPADPSRGSHRRTIRRAPPGFGRFRREGRMVGGSPWTRDSTLAVASPVLDTWSCVRLRLRFPGPTRCPRLVSCCATDRSPACGRRTRRRPGTPALFPTPVARLALSTISDGRRTSGWRSSHV